MKYKTIYITDSTSTSDVLRSNCSCVLSVHILRTNYTDVLTGVYILQNNPPREGGNDYLINGGEKRKMKHIN